MDKWQQICAINKSRKIAAGTTLKTARTLYKNMEDVLTELYVDLYLRFYRLFKNEQLAAILNFVLLNLFQLSHIYLVIAIVDRILSIDILHYLRTHLLSNLPIVAIIVLLNIMARNNAQRLLKKDPNDLFVARRFTTFLIITVILIFINWILAKTMLNS